MTTGPGTGTGTGPGPADEDAEPALARWLTVPGRILFVVTLIGCIAGVALYVMNTLPGFPAGRYPLFMWAVPVFLGGVVFFFGVAFLLEKAGVRVYRK